MTLSIRWFGFGGNSWQAEVFREDLEMNGMELKTAHEYPNADIPYNEYTIYDFIDGADIIILPARTFLQPAKSVNRLALAWSRRKACIVYPLNSYMVYAKDGENCLIVNNHDEMLQAIWRLRDDPELRKKIADNGHNTAIKFLHPRSQITKLFEALRNVRVIDPWDIDTLVQVIIPHYADRFDYLELTLKSVLESYGPRRDVLIISSSRRDLRTKKPDLLQDHRVRFYKSDKRLSFAEANNLGFKMALPYTTHFLLLNDDTIMGATALGDMLSVLGDKTAILNPYSNCDKGWLHHDQLITSSNLEIYPNMQIQQVCDQYDDKGIVDDLGHIKSLKEFTPKKKQADLIETTFCAMYCTLFPKEVFNRVGILNTQFSNGGEDADFCYRAKRFNIPSYWTHNAFVFHFGGKTRKFAEVINYDAHHKEDIYNNSLLQVRWPKSKKRIGIWTGPAWENWDLDAYRESGAGIGGSEYVEGNLAEIAAAEGHHVTLYTAIDRPKEQYGVHLVPWNQLRPEEEYFDLFISSRNVNCIDDRLKAKNILVHVHDIWISANSADITPYHRSKVTKFVCLSPWHKGFFSNHHKIPLEDIIIIPNGIKTELFEQPDLNKKVYGKFIYSSSPDRELDNLIYILKFVKDAIPETHLDVYYGFFNWESAARQRNNSAELKRIDQFKRLIEDAKGYVNLKGRVNQPTLAKAWQTAYMWLYPTLFTESYCLTAKEAQLSSTPILCSNVAALQTTVGDYGYRVQHHPKSLEGRTEFYNKAVQLLKNKDEWVKLANKSYEGYRNISFGDRWRDYWSRWL